MPEQSALVKITRPRVTDALPRARLFERLDRGRSQTPVIWISGPAGSGKTTLLASYLDACKLPHLWYHLDEGDSDVATFFYYLSLAAQEAAPLNQPPLPVLTREYLRGIPAFARRYFENLCSRMKPPHVVVLDNYHQVESGSLFHDMISEALSVIPEGITVMINSRSLPPPSLARLCVYHKMELLGWEDLKFDETETEALIRRKSSKGADHDMAARIQRLTTGWAAGLALFLEQQRAGSTKPYEIDCYRPDECFDYFTAELFEKTDSGMQTFLLKTSFLPHMSPRIAAELTDNENAEALLAELNRNHFFTELSPAPGPVYQYHPLFREFLQARARRTYSLRELRLIMRTAAVLLDAAGQFEDAMGLHRMSEDWTRLVELIKKHARVMISRGRSRTLELWLAGLPEEVLALDPWLLYWMGLCRMPSHRSEGRNYYERSFFLFRQQRNPTGIFLSWCGAVESLVQDMNEAGQLEHLLVQIEDLVKLYDFPSPEIEAQVTAWIFVISPYDRDDDPMFVLRRNKALEMLESEADIGLRLNIGWRLLDYYAGRGEYSAGERILRAVRLMLKTGKNASPQPCLRGLVSEALFALQRGSFDLVGSSISEALSKSRENGIHTWDNMIICIGAQASLYCGDLAEGGRLLKRLAAGLEGAGPLDRFSYYYASSLRSFLVNDLTQALLYQEAALAIAPKSGILFFEALSNFAMAHIMEAKEDRQQAKAFIDRCRAIGRRLGSSLLEFMCLLTDAASAFDAGSPLTALTSLRNALSLGREKEYLFFPWWHPSLILRLCAKALEAGIESAYVSELVRKCNRAPEEPPVHIENWPWAVRIYTLGRFKLLRNGEQIRFSGKVQKKPLDLLKAVIAFGGQEVKEEHVIDALWPDADGDMARISLKTTLHRIRQLLGREEIIQVKEGRISLDQRYCWVDVWAFERMLGEFDNRERRKGEKARTCGITPSIRFAEKALDLYRGRFLVDDDDKSWTASLRERLRLKYLFVVNAAVDHWLQQHDLSHRSRRASHYAIRKAVECCHKGLEIDDVAEELYQKLMICHQKLNSNAEAAKVYHRCRAVLSSTLGVEPSEKTKRLFSRIRTDAEPDGLMYYI